MSSIITRCLRDYAREVLDRFQRLFGLWHEHLAIVPVMEGRLHFRRHEPCEFRETQSARPRNVPRLLFSHKDERWTLLTGVFGSGKTTSVLHAALLSERTPVYVQALKLDPSGLRAGTNLLIEEVVRALNILEILEPDDRGVLEELAGAVLAYLLRLPESDYLFIVDGLDENRIYTRLTGLEHLSNQLAEFSCPVLLTSRKEHVSEMFGDFSLAFTQFSTKFAPNRHARYLELKPWGTEHVLSIVKSLRDQVEKAQRSYLEDFLQIVESGEYVHFYGDLPFNPLFLQFILEDVLSQGVRPSGRPTLIRSWIEKKVRRDRLAVAREMPIEGIDTEEFVWRILKFTDLIGHTMTEVANHRRSLREYALSGEVLEAGREFFDTNCESVLGLLLHSVLVPLSFRRGNELKITFALRLLHEFAVAEYLWHSGLEVEAYPEQVQILYHEMQRDWQQ